MLPSGNTITKHAPSRSRLGFPAVRTCGLCFSLVTTTEWCPPPTLPVDMVLKALGANPSLRFLTLSFPSPAKCRGLLKEAQPIPTSLLPLDSPKDLNTSKSRPGSKYWKEDTSCESGEYHRNCVGTSECWQVAATMHLGECTINAWSSQRSRALQGWGRDHPKGMATPSEIKLILYSGTSTWG